MNKQMNHSSVKAISELNDAVLLITSTLLSIKDKRVTLEEKMIKNHLHELAKNISYTVGDIHTYFKEKDYEIDEKSLEALSGLALDIQSTVGELEKIVGYNWNFLEQYYEHGYYGRLVNEHKFLERLKAIRQALD